MLGEKAEEPESRCDGRMKIARGIHCRKHQQDEERIEPTKVEPAAHEDVATSVQAGRGERREMQPNFFPNNGIEHAEATKRAEA